MAKLGFMGRIMTIALGAFKQSVRERVLYNLIVFAFLMIGAAVLLGNISVGVEQIILVNLGLSAISVFGLLIAIFIGIGLVSKEIDQRTIYNILAKPVTRAEFIIGKYAGLLLTLFVNTAIMTAGFYVALAIQKKGWRRKTFPFWSRCTSYCSNWRSSWVWRFSFPAFRRQFSLRFSLFVYSSSATFRAIFAGSARRAAAPCWKR